MKKYITDMNPGEIANIIGFSGNLINQSRLVEMGLLPGVKIRLVKKTPLNGPIELKIRDYYVTIRQKDAINILIQN